MNKFQRHIMPLCVVAACLAPATARAGSFYAFGDSLVDNGNIPKLANGLNFPPAPYYQNRFSNGPVWAEYFPGLAGLGFTASNDYGVGGAFAGPLNVLGTNYNNLENLPNSLGEPAFGTTLPSFLSEVQSFAATGQHLGAGDVVGVWVGANDYFATLALVNNSLANPVTAVPAAVQLVASQTAQGVSELAALGGQRFIVFTLPNLGSTPAFNTQSAQVIGLANQISQLHAQFLSTALEGVHASTGANIIVINEQQLFNELLANPAAYGKTNVTQACINVTACVTQSTALQNQYVFWDSVHPTTGTHLLIAEYAANALSGVNGLTVPVQISSFGASAFSGQLSARMGAVQAGASGFAVNLPQQSMVAELGANDVSPPPATGKLSGFFSGNYDFGNRKSSATTSGFNYNVASFALGLDDQLAPGIALGAALGYGTDTGTADQGAKMNGNAYQFGAYATFFQPDYYLNLKFSYGIDQYKNSRPGVVGGNITSKPGGSTYDFGADTGYIFHAARLNFGPVAGVELNHAHVNAYSESGDPALTQSVGSQDYERVIADAGVTAGTDFAVGSASLHPHVSVTVDDLLSGNGGNFSSVFTDEPTVTLTSTYPKATHVWAELSGGVSASLTRRLSLSADFATTVAKSDGEDHQVSATLRYMF